MANLLYAEYNTGCYVGWVSSDVYEPEDYCYGDSSNIASYYADLEPNTTYTIQRIDNSSRFRLGLSAQDLKYLSATTYTEVQSPFSWGYKADSSNPITFTTTATATHLVVYYTNNSEYSTRVMLNEGSSVEPYEAPTRYFKSWHLINDELVCDGMPEPIEQQFIIPYPATLWRLDSDDILTLNNEDWSPFPEPIEYLTPPYPATMWYLDDKGKLETSLLPDSLPVGAFARCTSFSKIVIPEATKSIGEVSFTETALIDVTIAEDCSYYPTSFPEGCEIKHY